VNPEPADPYWSVGDAALYLGDCVNVIATLPPASVDAVITSPPYAEQRKATYGGVPEKDYPAWTVRWMDQVSRVLKPDGSVVINIRPHVRNGQISDYTLRTRLAIRDAGWAEIEELIWLKRSAPPVGNIDRPRRSWESLHWFAHQGKPWVDTKRNGQQSQRLGLEGSRGARIGWAHAYGLSAHCGEGTARCRDVAEVNQGGNDAWEIAHIGVDHPAPYPASLPEWVARLVCPPGGTILDPFNGSASTGVAAIRNGYRYIGIDCVEEYLQMSARRLEVEASQPRLDYDEPLTDEPEQPPAALFS
jgi:site-specific DNA-methyltransferase (adenine-specific)/site-specific DNA-methyltransferase (cytosine-N4-specific)